MSTRIIAIITALVLSVSAQPARAHNPGPDFDGNGIVNDADLSAFVRAWSAAVNASPTPRPSVTPSRTPTATSTPRPSATSTPAPTATVTETPIPSATPTVQPGPTATPGSLAGQPCPDWVHDQYFVVGEDGDTYPTWHPQVDPATLCVFAHEHGDDPRRSLADPTLPAFGYAQKFMPGHVHGEADEPHVGFKVFVANDGDVNDEGFRAVGSSRIVFHMGTSGIKRVTTQHHSFEYDMIHPDGWELHVNVMADTAKAGDICQRDAGLGVGRVLPIVESESTCPANSSYEIWAGGQTIKLDPQFFRDVEFGASVAAFDPATHITADLSQAIPSGELGCRREAYHEGGNFRTHGVPAGGQWIVVVTDALGNVLPTGAKGITQRIRTMGYAIGVTRNTKADSRNIFKKISESCSAGLALPN
jgi:hypothetical protein